jgi:RNA recognition motif-containing protein
MNIFVGNLSFEAKEADVERAFMAFGVVTSVAIVMEKKGKKSRGFGFVEMPDEQEAQSAIAALHGRELLGRPVNVMPALSKEPRKSPSGAKHGFIPQRTGKYREGRRSLSYAKQRTEAGLTVSVPERRYKSNPMRWRKKPRWSSPSQKPEGEIKPWKKTEGVSRPWEKSVSKPKPWRKSSTDRQQPGFKKRSNFASRKK